MADFYIHLNKNAVKSYRVINGELEIIRFLGESSLSKDGFWEKFKSKIEYEKGDKHSFLIASDDAGFSPVGEMDFAHNFDCDLNQLHRIVLDSFPEACNLITFPRVDLQPMPDLPKATSTQSLNAVKEKSQFEELDDTDDDNVFSLQSFYRRKTRDYQRG
ncbi:hypothetical protein ACOMICROBIO_GDFFDHBD_03240 [Vibrio sp. B1REV9]|uniref:hypothetical protein n=1 Tax=Vibrio sp. B1REV9 TaxID=2751179 RepID=UPI001B28FBA9|nr:hypothetical protein [Vibrio sp. B1REV9]CAE6944352.1 hypothetical protein ACOMICROBIO_GDFFDHBD_03240 [Vibrio sp. B1REV9]